MLKFSDLPDEDQAQAIYQALALLNVEGNGTLSEARALAEGAYYPEEDDVILFLLDVEEEVLKECGLDIDCEASTFLFDETDPEPPLSPSLRNRTDAEAAA